MLNKVIYKIYINWIYVEFIYIVIMPMSSPHHIGQSTDAFLSN